MNIVRMQDVIDCRRSYKHTDRALRALFLHPELAVTSTEKLRTLQQKEADRMLSPRERAELEVLRRELNNK